ncbi:MAG: fimbria major subunit [Bacteroides sp.]|nr:fimbria major subunit [Bacteroides sp.]
MNKLFTFLASAALIGSLSACSSDEPTKGPDNNNPEEGTTLYLNVRISDATALSRAGEDITPNEGDYVPSTTENNVSSAHFFFFGENKVFVTEANIWRGQEDEETSSDETPNVELESNNMLVLRNLSQNNLPKYLITVINAPSELLTYIRSGVHTMDEIRNETINYMNGSNFIMSTSSFILDNLETGKELKEFTSTKNGIIHNSRYHKDVYWANYLKEEDFLKEPKETLVSGDNVVDIYVERLAAKFTTTVNTDPIEFEVTIAGFNNPETGDSNTSISAATKIYVKIDNFGVTGTETKSHVSKSFDKGTVNYTSSTPWEGWNKMDDHRSFWGHSVSYGTTPNLDYTTFKNVNGDPASGAVYANETTNSVNILQANSSSKALKEDLVTNYVFTATVYEDKDCTRPLDLVLFSGVYYKKEQFKKYILRSLQESGKLNYYTYTTETTDDGEKKTWTPLNINNIEFEKEGDATGVFRLSHNLTADVKLYEYESETPIENALTKLNDDLNSMFVSGVENEDGNYPTAFTQGKMFYSVPVEHLLGENAKENRTIEKEGEYGVVRNHWYQLEVNKVMKLGNGVFDPTGNEKLIPTTTTTENYALGARIKILSWKIVKQTVDL